MKSRATLVLMEQTIMLLVFALAAAACLGVFLGAESISRDVRRQDDAVLLGQNTAELLKACEGSFPEVAGLLEGSCTDDCVTVLRDGYTIEILPHPSATNDLGMAEISVFYEEDVIFSLVCAWQEVA